MLTQDEKLIDELSMLLKENFLGTDEGEVDGCLSTEIRTEDGKMTLKHPRLTKMIIEVLDLKDVNPKATLVVKPLLNKNANGKERNDDSFHSGSAIGSLSCLAGCTRPDDSMAVHQATKCSTDPKASHDTDLKRIGKCSLDTT